MCTLEKRGSLFFLTLIGDDHEHRLDPSLIDYLLSTLSQAINGRSSLVTVAHGKFFCNFFNVPWGQFVACSRLHQMVESFRSVMSALLSFHIPTIVAVSALGHDYVLMRRDVLLRGMKVKGEEAVRMGIVDSAVHDSEESFVEAAVRLGDSLAKRKWNGEVYAEIRMSLYPEICGVLVLVSKTIVASSKL